MNSEPTLPPDLTTSVFPSQDTPASVSGDYSAASNPWGDAPAAEPTQDATESQDTEEHRLRTPDPSTLDTSIAKGFEAEVLPATAKPDVPQEVLSEFDPLASPEEQAARVAWASAEGHPPPPRTPSPPHTDDEEPAPAKEGSGPPVPASSTFQSLAALARTFSIPTFPRPRPVSLDTAKAVPSPATISSFAAQQEAPREPTAGGDRAAPSNEGDTTPSGSVKERTDASFDFQKFLDQMKSKGAEAVSKYLRSFLSNFAKRTFTVNDQVKIINDFLNFISTQMRVSDVWKNASDTEFDNAMEGMEKLVMNRLYDFTFTPQVVHAIPPRPITADDLERDRVLTQRIALFGWIEEKHLDIPESEGSKGFLMFAQQELLKINHYKAPRDKLICILNACKVIFGLIRHLHNEEGADAFVPILIFVVLKANPEHLLSNVEFINRFRNPEKLRSEAGYYLSSLMGAVSFIETMDHTSLSNIDQAQFERNVEEAIQSLPPSQPQSPSISHAEARGTPLSPHAGEESAQPLSLATPSQTLSDDAKRLLQKTGDTISKPLNAIGRIFTEALDGAEGKLTYLPGPFAPFELGREQRAEAPGASAPPVPHWSHPDQIRQYQSLPNTRAGSPAQVPQTPHGAAGTYTPPIQTPYKPRVKRVPSPGGSPGFRPEDTPSRAPPQTHRELALGPSQGLMPPRVQSLAGASVDGAPPISRAGTPGVDLDLSGIQAQIDHAHEQAESAARETLMQIFPHVDREVVEWVLEANAGDLGKSIEGLLEMGSGA